MIAFAELCLCAALAAAPLTSPAADFQGGSSLTATSGQNRKPGAGTPEPATMLLLAGGALGYGTYRLRRRNGASTETSIETSTDSAPTRTGKKVV